MKTILLQGDSITDCSRYRQAELHDTQSHALGHGYPLFFASAVENACPGEYRVLNRGISGNRITDILARIQSDLINLAPDYLSLLIGVNDIWHEWSMKNGTTPGLFERTYRLILDEVKAALPAVKIHLFTPFVLQGSATVDANNPAKWEFFRDGVAERAALVERIAADYGTGLTVTQPLIDEAATRLSRERVLADGVHPAPAGHAILSGALLRWFETAR